MQKVEHIVTCIELKTKKADEENPELVEVNLYCKGIVRRY